MYHLATLLKNLLQASDRTGRSIVIGFVTNTGGIIKPLKKKVAGALEVPQVPAVNPEAVIRHQHFLSKSTEEKAQVQRDNTSFSEPCILGQDCWAVMSPCWGPAGLHHRLFLPVCEGFL